MFDILFLVYIVGVCLTAGFMSGIQEEPNRYSIPIVIVSWFGFGLILGVYLSSKQEMSHKITIDEKNFHKLMTGGSDE